MGNPMSDDPIGRMNRLIRKLDDESASITPAVRNSRRDADFLKLALAGQEPLSEVQMSVWQRLKEQLFPQPDDLAFRRRFALVAVAAIAALVVIPRALRQGDSQIPVYALSISGDASHLSATAPAERRAALDSMLSITLRPASQAKSLVEVRAFRSPGSHVQPWNIHMERAESGTFHLRSSPRELGLEIGSWELLFALAPPGELPSAEQVTDSLADRAAPAKQRFQLLRQRIAVVQRAEQP